MFKLLWRLTPQKKEMSLSQSLSPYKNTLQILPVEQLLTVFRHFSLKEQKMLRLVNRTFNLLVVDNVYKHYHLQIFKGAITSGDIDTVVKIHHLFKTTEIATSQRFEMKPYTGRFTAFQMACRTGHVLVLRQLFSWASDENKKTMIMEDRYCAFTCAVANGHLGVLRQLYAWTDDKQLMIAAQDYQAFSRASFGHLMSIMRQLIS